MFFCLRGDVRVHEIAQRCAARRERVADDAVLFRFADRSAIEKLCVDLEIEADLGVATSRFVAEVASLANATVEAGEEARFLAPLSICHLPIDPRRLQMLGLRKIGQVATLTEEELYAILGEEGLLAFALVRGIDDRPLVPDSDLVLPEVNVDLDEGIEPALQRLFIQLSGLCLALQVSCEERCFVVRFSGGTADWRCAARHLDERLHFDAPPEGLRLVITEIERQREQQLDLFHRRHALRVRRSRHLLRIVWDSRHSPLPERRAHLESLSGSVSRPLCVPRPITPLQPATILDRWQVDEEWWTSHPIRRAYSRIRLRSGAERRIFRDCQTGQWFRQ